MVNASAPVLSLESLIFVVSGSSHAPADNEIAPPVGVGGCGWCGFFFASAFAVASADSGDVGADGVPAHARLNRHHVTATVFRVIKKPPCCGRPTAPRAFQ